MAFGLIPFLKNSNTIFQGDTEYSIIVSQSYYASYYAQICVKNFYAFTSYFGQVGTKYWGEALLMQMRWMIINNLFYHFFNIEEKGKGAKATIDTKISS